MKPTLHPERADILPLGSAPKHLRKWLRDVGGVTPWGENRYRLVLAECVMLYVGARWHDWSPEASFNDMGGLEFSEDKTRTSKYVMRDPTDPTQTVVVEADIPAMVKVKDAKPVRVVEEMRWIQRYADKGWMLQVWYPSSYYSPEHYEVTVANRPDLPLLGEFPNHGQYERQFFYLDDVGEKHETFPTIPGQSWMERAIQYHEHQLAKKADESPNRAWRMLKTLQEIKSARDQYERQQREAFESEIKDRISPIFSNSLSGGRFREQLAQRCRAQGIKLGHVGN